MNITQEELNSLKILNQKIEAMIQALGKMEIERHRMLHSVSTAQQELLQTEQTLFEKYGHVTVNMETGEYKETKE